MGDATPAFPDVAEFPLHGLRKDGLKPSPKMASQCKPHAILLHCLDTLSPKHVLFPKETNYSILI